MNRKVLVDANLIERLCFRLPWDLEHEFIRHLRAALEAPAPKPVAWRIRGHKDIFTDNPKEVAMNPEGWEPLYLSPPEPAGVAALRELIGECREVVHQELVRLSRQLNGNPLSRSTKTKEAGLSELLNKIDAAREVMSDTKILAGYVKYEVGAAPRFVPVINGSVMEQIDDSFHELYLVMKGGQSNCNQQCAAKEELVKVHQVTESVGDVRELDGTEPLTLKNVKILAIEFNKSADAAIAKETHS